MTGAEPTAALGLQENRGASFSSPGPRAVALLGRPTRWHLRTQCDEDQAALRGPLETLDPEPSAQDGRRWIHPAGKVSIWRTTATTVPTSESTPGARRETTIPLSRRDGDDRPARACCVITTPTCDWMAYPPTFVLRPSAKPHRNSRKMIVATMASVTTSATAFVSTMSTARASRTRPPATTNKERFNLSTASTRLTRSSRRV